MKFCSICQQDHLASVACPGVSAIVIEGYRAMNPISSGAFELHRAQENASGRTCLITVVASDDATALKFLDQAKHAARSFNPAVAEVYDAGRLADGRSYVAWEELEGRTIREILDNVGAPRLLESIQIVRQAAEALHSLHAAGLTHGRVNPESIIITRGRDERASVRLQIPDFGSAMRRSMFDNRFALDSALDSLRYYAPEQCGDGELGAQADIYSLGIVFYEMLAGRPPFDAAGSAGLIHKHRNEAPPEIKIDDFNLRMLVTHALTEALQKRPTARQASAGLFARQLRHIEQLATHTSTPPPAGAVPRQAKPIETTPGARVDIYRSKHAPVHLEKVEPRPQSAEMDETDPIQTTRPEQPVERPTSKLRQLRKKINSVTSQITGAAKSDELNDGGDALFVTAKETLESLQSRSPSERVPREPRKIEWQTPDDDVPSEATLRQVLAKESVAEIEQCLTAILSETAETPLAEAIKPAGAEEQVGKGERAVAVGDQIVEKLPDAVAVEAPVWVEMPAVIQTAAPVEGAAFKPEDSVWVETSVQVPTPAIAEEPVVGTRSPVHELRPTAVHIRKAKATPGTKAVSARSSRAATNAKMPEPAAARSIQPNMRPSAKAAKPRAQRSGLGFPVNLADLEEITIVRPASKRIRVDWERAAAESTILNTPSAPRPPAAAVEFSPTILGAKPVRKAQPTKRYDHMFSALVTDPDEGAHASGKYHRVLLGVAAVALIGLSLLGFGSVTRYFETSGAADPAPPQVTQEFGAAPAPAAVPAKNAAARNSVKPETETKPAAEAVSTGKKSIPEKPDPLVKKDSKLKPEPSKALKPNSATAAKASKLGSQRAAKSSSPKSPVAKTPPAASQIKESTRPRIVKNAKP